MAFQIALAPIGNLQHQNNFDNDRTKWGNKHPQNKITTNFFEYGEVSSTKKEERYVTLVTIVTAYID